MQLHINIYIFRMHCHCSPCWCNGQVSQHTHTKRITLWDSQFQYL